jgi:YidC/Oxa1 family membrane protein insertase
MSRLTACLLTPLSCVVLAGMAKAQEGVPTAPAIAPESANRPRVFVPGKVETLKTEGRQGQALREEQLVVPFPADKPAIVYTFTSRGATTVRAVLQDPRYTRDAHSSMPGVPEDKVAAGQIDLVSTWDASLLPFSTYFIDLQGGDTTLLIRKAVDGVIAEGQLKAPERRDTLTVDRPVREGDALVVSTPAEVAGTYRVVAVGAGGSIKVGRVVAGKESVDFPVKATTQVSYVIERTGQPKTLFESEPSFARVSKEPGLPLTYVWPDPAFDRSSVWIERRIEAGDQPYELKLTVTIHNVGDRPAKVLGGLKIGGWQHPETKGPGMFSGPTAVLQASCLHVDGVEHVPFETLRSEAQESYENGGDAKANRTFPVGAQWVSIDTNYFLQAAIPTPITEVGGQCQLEFREFSVTTPGAWLIAASIVQPNSVDIPARLTGCVPGFLPATSPVAAGAKRCDEAYATLGADPAMGPEAVRALYEQKRKAASADASAVAALDAAWDMLKEQRQHQAVWRYNLVSGPKDTTFLDQSHPQLTRAVQFGWMDFVGAPLHKVMVWLHSVVGNWPFAIILLTILLKLLTWPLSQKSYVSMQKMKDIKPKLDELKRKFGNDRQKFAQEQMALMKREGVNPFAGCLPMLIQIPIWMGLYGAILGSVELYREPLGLWVPDLSSSDPYFILPLILGALMYVQTVLTPQSGMEEMQAKIMKYGMPIMFTVFMLFLPSGLVLYILVNTLLTIGQNLLIKRKMEAAS